MAYANVINEPVKDYKPGSEERKTLLKEYERQSNEKIEIPIITVSYTHLRAHET